ncbi:eukaryotic translation initiation factor 3 subunit K-like [Acropora palmata]|uniref:eukaryotic translation initiation factor 3 subunit K-like n=1 Tax=Acropora millepora TaxID=45264 RepID=UPI001CF36433|nr:eukaryotic translation initiation factor 3 subunit K-like [Acropora millepora]
MADEMREKVSQLLKGIDRYNPENLKTLEGYVHFQVYNNAYDVDANLAVLKLYQFNPAYHQTTVTMQILLKALMMLPNADFIMCRCLIDDANQQDPSIDRVLKLAEHLEKCNFLEAWKYLEMESSLVDGIVGFHDAIRKYVSYVIGITYQTIDKSLMSDLLGGLQGDELDEWIKAQGWTIQEDGKVFICNQEAHIKSKNIAEKIDFECVAEIIASAK